VLAIKKERNSLEGGRPSRVLASGMMMWRAWALKGMKGVARWGAPLIRGGPTFIFEWFLRFKEKRGVS
jgi:hypothetical protein